MQHRHFDNRPHQRPCPASPIVIGRDRDCRQSTDGGRSPLGTSQDQVVELNKSDRGEAELLGATQTKGISSMLMDFDLKFDATVCTDASAAISMSYRRGLGRNRHFDAGEHAQTFAVKAVSLNTPPTLYWTTCDSRAERR